jgi:hypothetical protein
MQGIDLKINRIRAGVKQWMLAQRMGIPQWRLCILEGKGEVPQDIAQRYLTSLKELEGARKSK